MSTKDFIFVLGGPGSGKGTQSAVIAKEYGIGYLSTGDLLRETIKKLENPPKDMSEEELNKIKELAGIMKNGGLVDDKTVIDLIKKKMSSSKEEHWFIDGFPRKMSQCEAFAAELGEPVTCLYINVPEDVLINRLLKRGETSGRADDNEEAIKKRLKTYIEESQPVIEHYKGKGKVAEIDGNRSIDQVHESCVEAIKKHWKLQNKVEEAVKNSKCCLLI